ncbi:MAG: hypothetical protein QOK40_2261 [Miltoncostaeaceae bacterium]|jgi:hypothetical protein|nr:hypothetical protein [Miltoncostaeaceae bacterium]
MRIGRTLHVWKPSWRTGRASLAAAALTAALLGASLGLSGVADSATISTTTTLTAEADAYVRADLPTANYGVGTTLRPDATPATVAYLRFPLQGVQGTVTSAVLRIRANSSHAVGYAVSAALGSGWAESSITYGSAPVIAPVPVGSSGPLVAGAWSQVDVTSLVAAGPTVSMALTTTSGTAMSLASRETGVDAPQLVVSSLSAPDVTAPSVPTGLTAATGGSGAIDLAWQAASDDVGVAGYTVYRDGQAVPSAGGATSFKDEGLAPRTWHSYRVDAVDAAGNRSAASGIAFARAGSADSDPVIAAAGDIACDPADARYNGGAGTAVFCRQAAVSDLLVGRGLAAVLPLGDNAYYCGSLQSYQASYAPTWGRLGAITRPVLGNHEYLTVPGTSPATGCDATNAGASGYFGYFGAAAGSPPGNPAGGYYSYDIGSWHLIALNSQCTPAGGCSTNSPQGKWLADDLATHKSLCTLAYWHIPLFSSGGRASATPRTFWDQLSAAGVDVVLNGHDHLYERFAPQSPAGVADPARGIREFVVGTGGANHTSVAVVAPNSEVRNATTYGALQLTLRSAGYSWQFVPEQGAAFTDSGSGSCH